MRYVFLTLCLLILSTSLVRAEYDTIPDQTILISDLQDIVVIDDYAVAVTSQGIASYSFDQTTGKYAFSDVIFLDVADASMKHYGNFIVVQAGYNRLLFIEISSLPHLEYLGTIDFDVYFADFAIENNDIYVSLWFDGIWRYRMEGPSAAEFVDSSMVGILVTQLDIHDNNLYALDEYNGLLCYDLSVDGFGEFIDYLYVPRRPSSFLKYDSEFCLTLDDGGAYIGEFFPDGAEITDSVSGLSSTQAVYATDSLLTFVCGRELVFAERANLQNLTIVEAPLIRPLGDFVRIHNIDYLMLPESDGGATLFNLTDPAITERAFDREGQMTALEIFDSLLFIGGLSSPVDAYQIGSNNRVSKYYTIYEEWDSVTLMTHNGDTLLPLYALTNLVGFVSQSNDPDSFFLDYAVYAKATGAKDVIYMDEKVNDYRVMLVVRDYELTIYGISDSATLEVYKTWNPSRDFIRSVAVRGDMVYIDQGKVDQIKGYRLDENLELLETAAIGLHSASVRFLTAGDRLYAFQSDILQVYDISIDDDMDYIGIVALESPAYDAVAHDDRLYTVGPAGIAVYDIAPNSPVLLETGGRGAQHIAVGDGIIATAGADGVFIYSINDQSSTPVSNPNQLELPASFALAQNYPNPFNMETIIAYDLQTATDVELTVYNVLGQKVTTLVSSPQTAGKHTVAWDGTTASNTVVSSGVYFYRLTAGDFKETKKMLLVK